jgi:hypothetical protein
LDDLQGLHGNGSELRENITAKPDFSVQVCDQHPMLLYIPMDFAGNDFMDDISFELDQTVNLQAIVA